MLLCCGTWMLEVGMSWAVLCGRCCGGGRSCMSVCKCGVCMKASAACAKISCAVVKVMGWDGNMLKYVSGSSWTKWNSVATCV